MAIRVKSISIDPDLHQRFKDYVDGEGQKMGFVAELIIQEFLNCQSHKKDDEANI